MKQGGTVAYMSAASGQYAREQSRCSARSEEQARSSAAMAEARAILAEAEACSPDGVPCGEWIGGGASFYTSVDEMTPDEIAIIAEALTAILPVLDELAECSDLTGQTCECDEWRGVLLPDYVCQFCRAIAETGK